MNSNVTPERPPLSKNPGLIGWMNDNQLAMIPETGWVAWPCNCPEGSHLDVDLDADWLEWVASLPVSFAAHMEAVHPGEKYDTELTLVLVSLPTREWPNRSIELDETTPGRTVVKEYYGAHRHSEVLRELPGRLALRDVIAAAKAVA